MSGIVKVNKEQLSSVASELKNKLSTLSSVIDEASSSVTVVPGHSSFSSLTSKATLISNSLKAIYKDFENVSANIDSYITTLISIDSEGFEVSTPTTDTPEVITLEYTPSDKGWASTSAATTLIASTSYTVGKKNYSSNTSNVSSNTSNTGNYTYSYSSSPSGTIVHTSTSNSNISNSGTHSFGTVNVQYDPADNGNYNYKAIEKLLDRVEGITVTLPAGLGSVHTYMGWQCITARTSTQYQLREAAGMNFDEEGFAKIGDRYVVATTTTYGNVGDFIDVYQEDGTIIKCVIGDIKNQADAGCNEWGHNNGQCVIEFVVDKSSWYSNGMHVNPGTATCHPEWNQNITKIVNKGNFFDLIQEDAARFDSDEEIELVTV